MSSERTLPEFVFDTSGFVNAWTKHYRLPVFQGVWDALGRAMDDGVIVSPSEVQVEIVRRADPDLPPWIATHQGAFLPPEPSWNAHFGTIQAYAPHWFAGTGTHDADPFVVAMAMDLGIGVVTYEGQAFSGDPAKISTVKRSMPHVCASVGVGVATIFDVLDHLGIVL